MTAASVLDIIARLPGQARQAADAVSACTQVKMEDAPSQFKIPKSELQLGKYREASKRKEKQKWAIEKNEA